MGGPGAADAASSHAKAFLADAKRLIDWVIANVSSGRGFRGGFHGYDPQQVRLTWISTEHNVDVYAAATWLFSLTGEQKYADAASEARQFLEKAFDADHFRLGTKPDGSLADSRMLALDVQLWPSMAVQVARQMAFHPPFCSDSFGRGRRLRF